MHAQVGHLKDGHREPAWFRGSGCYRLGAVGSGGGPGGRSGTGGRRTPARRAPQLDVRGRSIGDEIVLHRRRQNLSQASLAGRLGVHQQTVSRWESAGVVPSPSQLTELEDAFELDRGVLLRIAGYLAVADARETAVTLPSLLSALNALADDELVVLIDSAWRIHRERLAPIPASDPSPPRRPRPRSRR